MNRRRNRQHRRSRKHTSENKTKSQDESLRTEETENEDSSEEPEPENSEPAETIQADATGESVEPPEAVENGDEGEVSAPLAAADMNTDTHAAESALSGHGPLIDENTMYTGDVLREYREHKGISLRSISNITRIGVPSLMAVEEERYEDLPNARIYVLGFVRCLAQEIGLDREVAAKSYIARWQSWWDMRSEEDRRSYR
ncbi:MAG: helix-turn-helix transcriptional regulator [Myxococcota bacterium]|nr:helix-turn-helix transcriptional regulator [Myxococcota bacterium]